MEMLEQRITSVELCKIINELRKEEKGENAKKLLHKDFMKKIRKEVETLENMGISNEGNFNESSYKDCKGEMRPCYSLNIEGLRRLLIETQPYADKLAINKAIELLGGETNIIYAKNRFEKDFGYQLIDTLKPLNIEVETQKSTSGGKYRIDFYLPEFNLAIEYDEEHHNLQQEKDRQREKEIKKELGCRIIRLDYKNTDAYNIGLVLKEVFNR